MCQPKEKGGLGVRDIIVVHVSLLAKWWWRLLNGENTLWKEVLIEKYGNNIGELVDGGGEFRASTTSRWWKDIINIEGSGGISWFNEEVERRV